MHSIDPLLFDQQRTSKQLSFPNKASEENKSPRDNWAFENDIQLMF
jgi:hypothetical protein